MVYNEAEEFLLDDRCFFSVCAEGILFYYQHKGDDEESPEWRTGFSDV